MQREASPIASTKIKNDPHRPVSRFSSVTSATPAKRITFFKSGDVQFSGVRMAIHKRSFKCFDALLDDLSQKVPLPFGVRTITTPRGTHSIQRLEQLEDGGCYLCSDRRYVKPVDMEAAGRRPAVWHHSHQHGTRKKPTRPEEPPSAHSGQHYHRHPKRIVLVKNNDPTVRISIILSRRTARSLRVFLDEISELMQCNVRKLYTLDGRKIDSIQSLMQCPNVLVCVGREPFKPLLLENLRKHSDEKLPGMGARSHSSVCSEGHESKKNVNFGLETKKSIIHPRSDSSNRSTRFSLSSEKSYPNGLCMTPGQMGCVSTCPYTKDVILNDDIEKRVLVNKDGSLSVEMKVRFRLVNDETLQWSTEIKKSATTSNASSSVKDGDAHYLQGKAEYSDPESNSACEAEEGCAPKPRQKHLEDSHCQNCCNHCQEYDIWKNPMHKDSGVNGARNSCSSSGSSHKILHKKASVDSVRTISRSSEEYTEHVVEKASCFQQTVEEGDTRVEYCSISRCCSHSEISGTATKLKSKRPNEDTCKSNMLNICHHSSINDLGSFEIPIVTEDRPISAVSNSSKVLESLKEDQDDDYDDLPPSASRASDWSPSNSLEQEKQFACVHCCGSEASQNFHLSPRPPSKVSSCSAHSPKHKKYRSVSQTPDSARSSVSKVSSRSPSCQCGATTPGSAASCVQSGLEDKIPTPVPEGSTVSNKSRARTSSSRAAESDVLNGDQVECNDGRDSKHKCKSAMSANSGVSGKSGNSTACPCCAGCEISRVSENSQDIQAQEADKDVEVKSVGGRSSKSHRSEASAKSSKSERSHKCTPGTSPAPNVFENSEPAQNKPEEEEEVKQGRSESALSALSNTSATSKQSNKSNRTACGRASAVDSMISEDDVGEDIKERTKSAMSVKSNASAKSKTNSAVPDEESATSALDSPKPEEINQDERAISPMSGKSNRSSKCRSSQKSRCSIAERTITPAYNNQDKESEGRESPVSTAPASHEQEPEPEPELEIVQEPRVNSAMSLKSNSSSKHTSVMNASGKSAKSQNDTVEKNVSPVPVKKDFDQDPGTTTKERTASSMSNSSKKSMKSNASSRNLQLVQKNAESSKLSEAQNKATQASDVESEDTPRIPSAMSEHDEQRSHKSDSIIADTAATSQDNNATSPVIENEKSQEDTLDSERPTSALSALSKKSKVSVKSDACSERTSKSKSELKPTVQETKDTKDVQNTLTVRSPSPKKNKRAPSPNTSKSPITNENNDRAPSGLSVNSRASSKSTKSNSNCQCPSKSNLKDSDSKIPSNKAVRSPAPSPCPLSDEPLSPVSTVSLGLGEEAKSEDLNERAESNMSQIPEENKSPGERSTPVPAQDDNANSSEVVEPEKERPKTATSMSSAVSKNSKKSAITQNLCKNDKRSISPASTGKPESVASTKSKAESTANCRLNDGNHRAPSALSDKNSCSKSTCKASQPSENNLTVKRSKVTPQVVIKNSNSDSQLDKVSTISVSSSKCSQSKVASGKVTPTGKTQTKDKETAIIKNISLSNLKIKESKVASDCISTASSVKSLKTSKSDNRIDKNEENTTQNYPDPVHKTKSANKKVMPVIHLDSSSDSVLSHTLSAAALLREKVGNARPVSRESGTITSNKNCDLEEDMNIGSKCEMRSSSNQQRKTSTSSETKSNQDQGLELMLSSLPSASPAEVINDWLKNIPTEGPMYELEDEFDKHYKEHEAASQISSTIEEKEEEDLQKETEEMSENVTEMKESEEIEEAAVDSPDKECNPDTCNVTEAINETDAVRSEAVATSSEPSSPLKLNKRIKELDLPRRCHSSVQVMKVLLSPKLDRCNSLPEVSPVYGRKLSTSAKGLLDCLADLQLIDSDPKNGNNEKYNEIIGILQSLWICEPNESGQDKHKSKKAGNCSAEDEFNPRSSSGVDVSSGSVVSGKGSLNGGLEKSAPDLAAEAPVIEQEALKAEGEDDDPPCDTPESSEPSPVPSDPRTPDIAERVRSSPEEEKLDESPEQQIDEIEVLQATEEVIEITDDQKETDQAEFSNKSSGNDKNDLKSAVEKESDPPENVGTSSSTQKGILTRRVSLDPDPVWVLSLLKKLEKQFMSHYAKAMAEFKVKWDLDDNEMLDKMISELKDEVQKRIQSSINRELQKIQSRAGRAPRPPRNTLSRESTVQTEQRRRRLKVMKNKSLSGSEDMNTASGTDVSDQRSDDEYCPCEACMKKKMESRAVQRGEALSLAPVMKEFDLRKILQTKKDPPATKSKLEEPSCRELQEHNNLDVVHEESEIHNDGKKQTDDDKEPEGEETADDGNIAEEENSEGQAVEDGEAEVEKGAAEDEVNGETEPQEEEEDNDQEEQGTDDKEEEADNAAEEAENAEDQEAAKEEDITEEERNVQEEEAAEAEEQETPKEEETAEEAEAAVEEDAEEMNEDKTEGAEESEKNEDGDEGEAESGETENAVEAEPSTNDVAETAEVEEVDEVDSTTNNNECETFDPIEDDEGDGNQDASTQAEDDAKDDTDENQGKTEEENVEQAEVEDCGTEENDPKAKSTDEEENQKEDPDNNTEKEDGSVKDGSSGHLNTDGIEDIASEQASDEDSGHRLTKQLTKTSIESQPGSMENASEQKVRKKLKDICSFMQSSESQDDSIVVITKQSPFTERRRVSSRRVNKEEVENEVIEWQVSPKRRNRSPARANKQRRPKDSDVKVDDLEF
ncbi:retinitis pigmentosa 1-like 1 protein [Astyanax mexicanus]|uniref:Retinitis pigmentosa 1-like 1 protein n=1 Tax=Astyanax mexicanus TaxID=7994 RepID=A0A8T2LFH5_ASTMX|nr:retinitis pigmentosa 1-like 1 protein [Astyanax mexicanus]